MCFENNQINHKNEAQDVKNSKLPRIESKSIF